MSCPGARYRLGVEVREERKVMKTRQLGLPLKCPAVAAPTTGVRAEIVKVGMCPPLSSVPGWHQVPVVHIVN